MLVCVLLHLQKISIILSQTCLHVASEHGAVENVTLMLAHGADLLAQDDHGLTALDIAEQAEHEACMEVLKQAASK